MFYRLSTDTVFVEVEGSVVLLEISDGKYFEVKGALLHMFDRLKEGASSDDMIAEIARHFEIDMQLATSDFQAVIGKLIAANLVTQTAMA
jgi:hypothetical protein